MGFSNGEVDRLGITIRSEKDQLSISTLMKLQEHRISHQSTLSSTFTILCSYITKFSKETIVTYRIKRIESILGKLIRYPDMQFSRMWDIGGCRVIVRDNAEVYKLKNLLTKNKRVIIKKVYDYIKTPQNDGYKGLHVFIKLSDEEKVVEIQIRNKQDHNWATLVEITDVLFGTKLKELGDHKELLRFHYLLSRLSSLTVREKEEIARCLYKYKYFQRLSEVFSRNSLKVRRQWFQIKEKKDISYYIIKAQKDNVPEILPFVNSTDAEIEYLKIYDSTSSNNVVLTHLPEATYAKISVAYSNYMLTYHSFLFDCFEILESLILSAIQTSRYIKFTKIFSLYLSLLYEHIKNLTLEITEFESYLNHMDHEVIKFNRRKLNEWLKHIKNKSSEFKKKQQIFYEKIGALNPPITKRFIIKILSFPFNYNFEKKLLKLNRDL